MGAAGRGQAAPLTGAEELSQKGVLRSEFARPAGREGHPQGPEGHAGTGGGCRVGQGRASLSPTHGIQTSAPSASLGHLTGMPTPGPSDLRCFRASQTDGRSCSKPWEEVAFISKQAGDTWCQPDDTGRASQPPRFRDSGGPQSAQPSASRSPRFSRKPGNQFVLCSLLMLKGRLKYCLQCCPVTAGPSARPLHWEPLRAVEHRRGAVRRCLCDRRAPWPVPTRAGKGK